MPPMSKRSRSVRPRSQPARLPDSVSFGSPPSIRSGSLPIERAPPPTSLHSPNAVSSNAPSDHNRSALRQRAEAGQSGFPRRSDSRRAGAQPEGHSDRNRGWDQQQRRQPYRERVGGQELSDRLLLYARCLVRKDFGAARDRGRQLVAIRPNQSQPIRL